MAEDVFSVQNSDEEKINVYFFWGKGCPHCEEEKPFLEKLQKKYPQIVVHSYEVWESKENRDLMVEFGNKLSADVRGVPFTVIGEKYVSGWMDESYTGAQIEDAIKCAIDNGCRDIGEEVRIMETTDVESEDEKEERQPIPEKLTVPLLGEIETKNLSLPAMTLIFGALDGFNPCAMWALLFLISLLLGMKDRKRMFILGSVFIATSALVYFFFMAAWLNLVLFIGMIIWVRLAIGIIALAGGGYNLKEYFTNKESGCKVTDSEKRQKIFEKLKNITQRKSFWLALGGILVLAFAVNLVELICSAGLPAIYTQVLTLSNLNLFQYYLYIMFYIFIFMLDDLFVFFAAMVTLQMVGFTTKYARWSRLISGIIMLMIGFMLIFKHEWLMFG
ncbi:MAG TPA: thioredoxin family protein [Candidatus Moranbacteria bacterium]|nr:thioredoxin family protein [Candidatus Moranbacteria bacterium]HQB59541.1 thioredoxin family protein [Candidatus Moranbacteria bacterium]